MSWKPFDPRERHSKRPLSWRPGWQTIGAPCVALGLVACVTTEEVADDPAGLARIQESIARVEPWVTALLGTRLEEPYEVHVLAEDDRTELAYTDEPSRTVYFQPWAVSADQLDAIVAHELVHVHATGDWEALPVALEQGLARYFQLVAGGEQRLPGPPPDLKRFLASMQLGEGEYARLRGAAREECEAAALWVVTSLGIEGTRELALLMAGKEPADPRAVAALSSDR